MGTPINGDGDLGPFPSDEIKIVEHKYGHARGVLGVLSYRGKETKRPKRLLVPLADLKLDEPPLQILEGEVRFHTGRTHYEGGVVEVPGNHMGQPTHADVIPVRVQSQRRVMEDVHLSIDTPADDQLPSSLQIVIKTLRL